MGNLAIYATKGFEYLLILGFLALFTAFYLYFTSGKFEQVTAVIRSSIEHMVDWFRVPDNILFHQGHTWALQEVADPGIVTVGIDDFAQKMIGPMAFKNTPAIGSFVKQGEKGWSLDDGKKSVDMLMPMSGEVVDINKDALRNNTSKDSELSRDPYEQGWLLKIKTDDFERERKGLMSGSLARKWMDDEVDTLRSKMSPELGAVLQDGGVPMPGMAKNINAEEWDVLLKEFFLT